MIKAGVRVENIAGLDTQFLEVAEAIDANLEEIAAYVESEAQRTSAFIDRTGNLRASIRRRKSKFANGGYIVMATGKGKYKGYHAANVEFGHVMIAWGRPTGRRVPPHPFMRPAKEKGVIKAIQLFRSNKR